ncbi:hypothetical protein NKR23_g4335 [Pleurostoma richardsiae]|uniref:DUF8021 domain-containing protein n=1 Tax=Pleurostoma richardsiae TaxID=41990 RepID=A0AA38RVJ9_9PEZI|nr:hypothetical protein NKR23_g4335 [Pleurostoma richardsiae]
MNLKNAVVSILEWSGLIQGSSLIPREACKRPCLENLILEYLNALTGHDPTCLQTTLGVKYVENDQILPLGTGEWQVTSSQGKYRHVFADPESGQAAAITTISENDVPVIYVVRLQLEEDGRISEIETQITRDPAGAALYEKMGEPQATWVEVVPPAERIPRSLLIDQSNKYYTGMERNDPRGNYSFFDKDCNRIEDGLQTTNVQTGDAYGHSNNTVFASHGCEAQFQTGFLGFVTRIRERRFPVVDEERQAILAITTLDHNGTVRELPDINGTWSPIPPYFDVPRTLQAAGAFRLRGDKLFRIEMTLTEVPYGMRPAFPGDAPAKLNGAGSNRTLADPCGCNCLENAVQLVLHAMLTNDTSALPLADGTRYSENGQFLALGDGLWETLGQFAMPGTDDYAASFTDPESGTAAYWGLIKEHSTPGVLALRVTTNARKITEIEAIAVRAESPGSRGGTITLMRPPLPVEWKGDSLGRLDRIFQEQNEKSGTVPSQKLLEAYFEGMERHSSASVMFSPGCTRRDNGIQANLTCAAQMDGHGDSPNGLYNLTTAVRDRRILVTDADKGVVVVVAMVDNPATGPAPLPATGLVPSTYMIPQLIKVANGYISRVECMIKWMPFGYTSAWTEKGL